MTEAIHDPMLLVYSLGLGIPSAGLFNIALANGPSWGAVAEVLVAFLGAVCALLLFVLWGIGRSPDMDDGWA